MIPLTALALFVAVAAAAVLVALAQQSTQMARAQWAADAAALAIASVGPDGTGVATAREVAAANGAVVVEISMATNGPGEPAGVSRSIAQQPSGPLWL